MYELHTSRLIAYAVEELHLPLAEAEQLADDIVLASLHRRPVMPDVSAWFAGAMDHATRRPKC